MRVQTAYSPSREELHKDMLVLGDNLIKFFAHDGVNGFILIFRDRLALQSGFKCVGDKRLDPVMDDGSSNLSLLVNGVLKLICQVLYYKARPDAFSEVESLCVVPEFDRVNPDEVDFSFVLKSDGPYSFDIFIFDLGRRVDKEVGEWLPRLGIGHVIFCVHLGNDGERKFLDPILDLLDGRGSDRVGVERNGMVESSV